MKTSFVFVLAFVFGLSSAQSLELNGDFVQGGLIVGKTETGATVKLADQHLRVSQDGYFIFGIGRDETGPLILQITEPDGAITKRRIEVKNRTWRISRIDGLPDRKVTPKPEDIARITADNQAIGSVRELDTERDDFLGTFQWPVIGRVSGIFGSQRILNGKPRRFHNGLDIAAPEGTIIKAPKSGQVVLVHPDMFYAGQTVMLDHGHGLTSVYIHMSETLVVEGQYLKQGEPIGKVGMTGRATGPHLHWGISWFKTHVDPALLLNDRPTK